METFLRTVGVLIVIFCGVVVIGWICLYVVPPILRGALWLLAQPIRWVVRTVNDENDKTRRPPLTGEF